MALRGRIVLRKTCYELPNVFYRFSVKYGDSWYAYNPCFPMSTQACSIVHVSISYSEWKIMWWEAVGPNSHRGFKSRSIKERLSLSWRVLTYHYFCQLWSEVSRIDTCRAEAVLSLKDPAIRGIPLQSVPLCSGLSEHHQSEQSRHQHCWIWQWAHEDWQWWRNLSTLPWSL